MKKNNKINKNNKNSKNNASEMEMGNLFKIILVILVVFGVFYIFTYYLQKDKKTTNVEKPNTITTIQYDEILIGNILNQSESDYYVLIVNKSDYDSRYKNYLSKSSAKSKFYYSLIDNGLNRSYITDNSNLMVENIQDLKVSTTSLLKISNGKIVETYDGNSAVMEAIININK